MLEQVLDLDRHALALQGLGVAGLERGVAEHAAADHVILQHFLQLALVLRLQQVLDRARRQLGERVVRGCEDGERARARQRLGEAGGLQVLLNSG